MTTLEMAFTTVPHVTDSSTDLENSSLVTPEDESLNVFIIALELKVIYIIIGVIGLLGNTFVMVVIWNTVDLRKVVTNTFILNQSVIDGLCGVFLIITTVLGDDNQVLSGLADEIYCRVWLTKGPLWACFTSSSFNLMAITIERYIAFSYPIWYKMSFTKAKVYAFIAAVWGFGFFIMIGYGAVSSSIVNGHCHVYSTGGLYWGFILVTCQYVLPIIFFLVCYTKLAFILRRKVSKVQDIPGDKPTGDNSQPSTGAEARSNKKDKKDNKSKSKVSASQDKGRNIIFTLLQCVACFAICWSWNQIYYLLYLLRVIQVDFASGFYHFTVVAVFCNCCCNPFVYTFSYNKFRIGASKLIFNRRGNAN